jgi:methylmalonyl-CoA mutase N-terminal domain/subunit
MRQQEEIESGRRVIVGVNDFTEGSGEIEIDTLKIDPSVEARQRDRMATLRSERDDTRVTQALEALTRAAEDGSNVVPYILDCARAYCTLYEIREAMEKVFGAYREPVFF